MVLANAIKLTDKKSWFLGIMALTFTFTSTTVLREFGEPRPLHIATLDGLIIALIMHGGLWLCCFKTMRTKWKYILAFFLFFSGLGTALITNPFGLNSPVSLFFAFSCATLIFHWCLIYDLLRRKA